MACCPLTASGPACSTQSGSSPCGASREGPSTWCTKRTVDHIPTYSGTFQHGTQVHWSGKQSVREKKWPMRIRSYATENPKRHAHTHSGHNIHGMRVTDCKGVKAQVRCRTVGRGQVDNQPAADSAVNFTWRTETLGHTCVNCIRVGPRSTLLSRRRQSGPVAVVVRSSHHRGRNFDDNQNTNWAILAEEQGVAHQHLPFS